MRSSVWKRVVALLALPLAFAAASGTAQAQSFPLRPVTILVGFAAGGITDLVARTMAERMKDALGQSVVVENVTGAAGTIAAGRLFRSAPDGYTVLVGQWSSHVGAGALYKLPFDIVDDFAPIARLTIAPLWIMGRSTLPAKDLRELVAWLKANPDKASAATTGVGSAAHLCLLDFAIRSGTRFPLVPYRGAAPIMQDMMGNQVDITCIEASQSLANYRAGKLRAYGVMTERRWFVTPEVPTMEEGGVAGLSMPFWHGMWAPKGTPPEAIAKLNSAVIAAFDDAAAKKRFAELGHEIPPREQLTPEALRAHHRAEVDKWWPIMRAANLKAEGQ